MLRKTVLSFCRYGGSGVLMYVFDLLVENEAVQERQLKLQIIEIYNSKLDERIYRKRTIISR